MSEDNRTHHLVANRSGAQICAYCRRTDVRTGDLCPDTIMPKKES